MKNRFVIFSDEINKVQELEMFVLKHGYFDFTFLSCANFDDCLSEVKRAKTECDKTFVICKNNQIDKLLKETAESADKMELISEQAVILKNASHEMLFVPVELDVKQFLNLPKRDVFVYSIFGNAFSNIEEKLSKLSDVSYKVITKSQLLHIIYISKPLDETWLDESVFSTKGESLAECVNGLLKGKSVAVADMTCVTKTLLGGSALKKSFMLLTEEDFENLGISKEFLAEKGLSSKETAYQLAKHLLKFAEIAFTVLVKDGKSFVAVGNKDEIHVYSFVFEGENFIENLENFALFEMLQFLRSKYVES